MTMTPQCDFDYSAEAFAAQHQASLQRLGLGHVDHLVIHDLDPGFFPDKTVREKHMETLARSGMPYLNSLKEQGLIKAWGAGVNHAGNHVDHGASWTGSSERHHLCAAVPPSYLSTPPALAPLPVLKMQSTRMSSPAFGSSSNATSPAVVQCYVARSSLQYLTGSYTLLEDEAVTTGAMDAIKAAGAHVVLAGPYNSGILITGANNPDAKFSYRKASPEVLAKVQEIENVFVQYGVPLGAAALQFCSAHPCIHAVIPGCATPVEVAMGAKNMLHPIPEDFWTALAEKGLLHTR
eukprot:gene3042-593_t